MTPNPILIADSGSTKTSWCLLDKVNQVRVETQGISLYFLKNDEIGKVIMHELLPKLPLSPEKISQIYFYGTGLASSEKAETMQTVLSTIFKKAELEINHDLTGAARALCRHEEGLASILGTGSGSCYFDGKNIVKSRPGLGFILGDEGSGAYLGKMLVQQYLYHELDSELTRKFEKKFRPSKSEILKKVYQGPYPNRYLASYAVFLGDHRDNPSAKELIENGIRDFLLRHIKRYEQSSYLPVHFVGGVAMAFKKEITNIGQSLGLKTGRILKAPMEGLVRYHQDSPEEE